MSLLAARIDPFPDDISDACRMTASISEGIVSDALRVFFGLLFVCVLSPMWSDSDGGRVFTGFEEIGDLGFLDGPEDVLGCVLFPMWRDSDGGPVE